MKLDQINEKRLKIGLTLCLFVMFLGTRLWQLTTLPFGMHIDEAGMAYDAWCLAQYGVDRYLKSWPVYLINFGGGQNALYTYLCAGLFKIFGYSMWMVRLPAAFFSFITFIIGMKMTRKLFEEYTFLPFVTGLLIIICPCFIMAGRFGLESNLMLGMSSVFLYQIVLALETQKRRYYILAGISGGLVFYTYALSYIILPLFLILLFIYVIRVREFSVLDWIIMMVFMGILAIPLILVQIVNLFDLAEFQLGCFTITKLPIYRVSELERFSFQYLLLALKSIFIGDSLPYNSIPRHSNLYMISAFLFVVGVIIAGKSFWNSVKKQKRNTLAILFLWLFSMIYFECHVSANVNKINGAFLVVILIVVIGMEGLFKRVGKYRKIFIVGMGGVYLTLFMAFGRYYYFGGYAEECYPLLYFDVTVQEAVTYIEQDPILKDKETQMAEHGIYYAISTFETPWELDFANTPSVYGNYRFGTLEQIEERCNYIVKDEYGQYCEDLRAAGFTERKFDGYSLFYFANGSE